MELRREQRISVSLNATLVDETAMPLGCRVCDVTSRGMLLQYSYEGGSAALDFGDAVTVRLSLRQGSGRTVVVLPSTIRRVRPDGVVVEFNQAQPSLLTLLEPYRIDEAGQPDTVSRKVLRSGAAAGDVAKRSYARVGKRGAESSSRRPTHGSALRARVAASRPELGDAPRRPARGDGALFYAGLAALVVAAAVLVFDILDTVAIRERLTALEAATRQHAQAISARPVPFRSVNGVQTDLKTLSERVELLAVSMSALESQVSAAADESAADSDGQPVVETASPPAAPETEQPAAETQAAAAASVAPSTGLGPWVINLASSSSGSGARAFVSRAASRDVPVEANQVTVKGKQMWRLQITGFATEQEARAYAGTAKTKLNLQDVWIFKR